MGDAKSVANSIEQLCFQMFSNVFKCFLLLSEVFSDAAMNVDTYHLPTPSERPEKRSEGQAALDPTSVSWRQSGGRLSLRLWLPLLLADYFSLQAFLIL